YELEAVLHLTRSGQAAGFSDGSRQVQKSGTNLRVSFHNSERIGSRTASQVEEASRLREIQPISDLDSTGTTISVHGSGHPLRRNIVNAHILEQRRGGAPCPYSVSKLCERPHKRMQKRYPFSQIGAGILASQAVEHEFTSTVTAIPKGEQLEGHGRIKGRSQGLFVSANFLLDFLKALGAERQEFKNSSFEQRE